MALDPRIAMGVQPMQVESPVNQLASVLKIQGMQDESAMNRLRAQEAQRGIDENNKLNTLYQGVVGADGKIDRSALYQGAAQQGIGSKIPSLQKQFMETDQAQAKLEKEQIDAAKVRTELAGQTFGSVRANPTLENAHAALDFLGQRGVFKPEEVALMKSRVTPENVGQFADQMFRMSLGAKEQLSKYETKNTGAQTVTQAIDPVSGKVSTVNTIQNTVSPDAQLHANVARQNNKDTIAKDYAVAGMNPDGTSSGANDAMVDAIGQYKVQPPNGMALRNPRMQQILAEVTAKYPNFDATQYGARQVAAKSFSTGKDGQSVQSANTALNHLGTLRELAAAQDNGDIRLFNTIANRIATETGGAAPTNLASAVTMVGPEISKAVIGAGGGQGDREKVDSALAAITKGGKGQAAGTLATMEDLFGGRLTEAQRTYERTTGRKDFADTFLSPAAQKVLSARTHSAGGGDVPPDIAAILATHGKK